MRTILYLTSAAFFLMTTIPPQGQAADGVAAEIIGLTRKALDRWGKGDVEGLLELYDSEITYFDPVQEKRVDGIEAIRKIYSPLVGKIKIDRYEMINPKVQQYSNVAVLTFNLLDDGQQPYGPAKVRVPWNCTQVYRRIAGKWRIVSEHWSYIKPEAKTIPIQ